MLVDGDGSRFVHLALSPLVGVAATVEAEAIAHANNLPTVAHLLGPFGTRVEGKVNILDSQGHAANHEGFSLRFAPLHQLAGPPLAAIKSALIDSVSNSHHPIPLNDAPWYHTYRNYVCKYNGASEHETFNHPVACIVVASTSAPDPIAQLSALAPSSPEKLPAIFGNGYMDTQIAHKYYVLLHDIANENNSVNPDILFTQMKKQFGLSCRLIRVNSKRPNDPEYHESKVWDSFMTEWTPLLDEKIDDLNTSLKTSPSNAGVSRKSLGALTYSEIELNSTVLSVTIENSKSNQDVSTEIAKEKIIYGNLMSENDVKSLEIFVREFVVQSLLPSMERSVQHWNEQVASSRRGFTGRLFTAGRRFLGTAVSQTGQNKSGTTSPGSISPESTIPFPHTSVELILRKLADYSFMLRDYKFAYSQYDSVKKDFSGNERAIKHFAGIQEMLALCVLMTRNDGSSGGGGLRGNVESLLESAIANYLDSGMSIYATRATMLVYECLKSKDGWKEAGGLLLRMVGEDSDLRSAILLEQSAFCHMKTGSKRKYAFFLVMAGDRFTKCSQREHALRCYLSAQKVYEASGWALIEDHNNFTTGRLQFHLGDPITSYKTFIKLLEESNLGQSTERQAEHLKEFLHVYKSIQKVENLPQTPLPVLLHQTVSVSLVQKLQAGQTSVNDAVWDKMENDLVENGFNKNGKPVKLMKAVRDGGNTICAVGEPVFVSFEVKNPLQIPLLFNDISLFARFDPSQAKPSLGDDHKSSRELKHCYEFFDLENIPKLTLEANETRRIQLTVFPKFEGEIAIDGINLTLSDTIPIFITFAKRGRRLNDTQKQRCSEQPVYAVDNTLKLSVTSPMPVLDIVFHAFPSVLLNGQVERAILEITNKGHRGLKDLKVKLSHPQFFEFGRVEQTDLPIYGYKPTNSFASTEISQIWNKIVDTSIAEIQLPNPTSTDIFDGILVAGATTKIPVWIRGDKTGKHAFRFLFGYQSEDENDKIGYRKLQYSMSSQVYPSLKINAFTRPSTNKLSEFILGVEIENMQGVEIKLRQFSSLSPVWGISPTIDAESANNMLGYVNGKQTSFAYFKFSHLQNIIRPHPSPESMTMNAIVNFVLNENLPVIHSSMYLGASNVTLHEEQVICNSAPFSLFSRRSRTIWRTQSLANHYPVIPSAKLPDLFTLYFTDDADIVLFWEAPPLHPGGPKRYGHHFIIGINLSLQAPLQLLARIGKNASNLTFATRSMYAATVAERKTLVDSLVKTRQKDVSPVRLIFVRNINDGKGEKSENSNTMTHNFKACGNLVISFFAHLRNTSWENPVAYSLELPPSNDNLLENDFTWIGITSMNGTLKPEQEVFLQLYACFSRKGVFDINRWRLNVTVLPPGVLEIDLTDGKGVASYAQIPNLPFLVTVAQ